MMAGRCWFKRASAFAMGSPLWKNRYYILGLVAQKGLPLLILPLIVDIFGRDVYGDYVLFFTMVQAYATISSLAIPQTIVPLWFRRDQPLPFVGICIAMLGGLAVLFAIMMLAIVMIGETFTSGTHILPLPMSTLLSWIVVFALSYNLNTLAVGVARSQDRQYHFFWGMAAGGLVMAAGVGICALIHVSSLHILILIQTLSIFTAAIVLFGRQPLAMLRFDLPTLRREWRSLLKFSLPLGCYTLLVLFSMGLDKWMARIWFSRDIFNTYVIDYQYAFAMVFVPTAINLYNGPRVSAYVARGQWDLLMQEERRAARLAIVGCLVVAVLMYIYAWISGLALSSGYWLLVAGFLFEGLYILRTNRLMAQLRSLRMLFISASGIAVYVMLLAIAAASGSRLLLYLAVPTYLGITLALALLYTKMKHDLVVGVDSQAGRTESSGPGPARRS